MSSIIRLGRCLWAADPMPANCLHHDEASKVTRPGSVAALKIMLRSDSSAVRRHAVSQLGQLGPVAVSALPALVELLLNEQGNTDVNVCLAMDRILAIGPAPEASRLGTWRRFVNALLGAFRLGTA
jgi:hypothetical protein